MATTNTKKSEYLFRLQTLIVDGGLLVLRHVLDSKLQVQSITLSRCLGQERSTITRLKREKTITKVQYDLLYPSSGQPPSTADFDITLTICLLRNLKTCGLNPEFNWNITPHPRDISIEADIKRLNDSRNEIAHILDTGIDSKYFLSKWTHIEKILSRLNSSVQNPIPKLQKTIDQFKNIPMEPEEEKRINKALYQWREMEEGLAAAVKLIKTDIKEVKERRILGDTKRIESIPSRIEERASELTKRTIGIQSREFETEERTSEYTKHFQAMPILVTDIEEHVWEHTSECLPKQCSVAVTGSHISYETRRKQRALRRRLIQHYRQTLVPEADRSLQLLKKKIKLGLFPRFKPYSEGDTPSECVFKPYHNVLSFIESLYSYADSDESRRSVSVSGQQKEVQEVVMDILNTWIDSVENEDHFPQETKDFDAVFVFQEQSCHEYYTSFDSVVCSYIARELMCSLEEARDELSYCQKYLVLWTNRARFSYLTDFPSFTTSLVPHVRSCLPVDTFFASASGDRTLVVSMKNNTFITENDRYELEKWITNRLESTAKHNVRFVNMRGHTQACINLALFAKIEEIEMHNCDNTFSIAHEAETLRLYGISTSNIDSYLEHSHNLKNLYLYFNDYGNGTTCHPLRETTVENIVISVDKCQRLQNIHLQRFSIGKHNEMSCCITRKEIENIKSDETVLSIQTVCSHLLGPHLETIDFDRSDVDVEKSQFTKKIILDSLCHKHVKSNENILEAYASEQNQTKLSGISIVCFLKGGTCKTTQLSEYKGFPVVQKEYRSVSTESIIAEADTNELEYDLNTYQKALCDTISFNVERLFREHSNLEAVCGSMVRSVSSKIEKSAPCVVLFCRWKGMVPYGENEFPKYLPDRNGKTSFVTDVREGFFMFGPNGTTLTGEAKDWNKELAMGCSIGVNKGAYSATLGPFLNVCGSPGTCFLTVRHMFQPLSIPDIRLRGTKIVQPADGDERVSTHGTFSNKPPEERLCGEVLYSHLSNYVDAAVIKISQSRMPSRGNFVSVRKDALHYAGFSESSFPTFDDGKLMDATILSVKDHATDRIIKFGKQSGLTMGSLDLHNMAVKIKDESKLSIHFNGLMQTHTMKHQLKIKSYMDCFFFQRGDSGSAVFLVDKNNKLHCIGMAIGLLTDGSCVVTPIQKILELLNKELRPHGLTVELKTFDFEQMDA